MPGHPVCPPSFCDGLCSAALLLALQSELYEKGLGVLGDARIIVHTAQLLPGPSPPQTCILLAPWG